MSIKAQIINLPLSTVSTYATCFIGKDTIATIHSIYNKTINLLVGDRIFALQPKDSYISPVSLITTLTSEQFQQLSLQPNQLYQFHFNYQNCVIFQSKLTACKLAEKSQLDFFGNISKNILQQANTGGLPLLLKSYSNDSILSACQKYLEQAQFFYLHQEYENSAKTLSKLLGLGIGLTPSGDDFLCGFLAAFQYFQQTNIPFYQYLTQEIKLTVERTNPISQQFIQCALEQQFSKTILDFFNLRGNSAVNIEEVKKWFEKIGHSSGMDTLFGIYYACELLKN